MGLGMDVHNGGVNVHYPYKESFARVLIYSTAFVCSASGARTHWRGECKEIQSILSAVNHSTAQRKAQIAQVAA